MAIKIENTEHTLGIQFLVVQSTKGPKTFVEAASSQKEIERVTKELEESGQRVVMSTTSRQEAIDKVIEIPPVNVIRGLQGSSM